jgi:hypothetical protein
MTSHLDQQEPWMVPASGEDQVMQFDEILSNCVSGGQRYGG